jgi:peptidyl-prolyl cis-trans isomerase D
VFDFVAKHKRFLQIVLALTLVPFAFFGLEAYTRAMGGGSAVAMLDGNPITQREFDDELRRQQERMREMFGRNADLAELETPQMRLAILESLIARRLVQAEVLKGNMLLPKGAVVDMLKAAPDFQEGGKFSPERYATYLRARGLSDEGYVNQLRLEVPSSRLASAISATAFQPREVAERLLAIEGQKREVAEAFIAADQYLSRVKIDDAKVKAYYEANAAEFRQPEMIRAEYVVLTVDELAKRETVTEAELKAAYEARASRFADAERRQASHILLATREEAEKVLAEVRKAPGRFAALAKARSTDAGSAEKGGDLGLFARGDVVKPFADAAFKMKEGEIAGPVQSEFGFHVIRLTKIQSGKVGSLEEMKKELTEEITRQKAAKKFGESAEGLNNLVYEQSDSLKPAAERYKLKLETTGWISKQPSPELGPLAHPKLLGALFGADALQQKRNTDAVEVAQGIVAAARVLEHRPAVQRPMAEVKSEIESKLVLREATALAQQEGTAKLQELAKGGDAGLKFSAARTVSRREPQGLDPTSLRRVMTAPANPLPAYVGLPRGDRGYAIYRISKVIAAPAAEEAKKKEELQRLDAQSGMDELEAYVTGLRARAKVEIKQENLEKK